MIKGAIFDIDGTLLDSMPIWENAGARYLATLGIKAKPDLKERLDALSLPEGAIYMQKEYGLSVSAEDILEGVNQVVKDFYYKEAVMKPGAYALVKRLKENGVKLRRWQRRRLFVTAYGRTLWECLPARKPEPERQARRYLSLQGKS